MKARNRIKPLLTLCCALLLVAAGVFGTLAYLTGTDTVNNTFTVGNVKITLDEARGTTEGTPVEGADRVKANEYHLLPGHTYTKDPTVTVEEGSDLSYVRMKVTFNNAKAIIALCTDPEFAEDGPTGVENAYPLIRMVNFVEANAAKWDGIIPDNMMDTEEMLANAKYFVYDKPTDTLTYYFYYNETVAAPDGDVVLPVLFDKAGHSGEFPDHRGGRSHSGRRLRQCRRRLGRLPWLIFPPGFDGTWAAPHAVEITYSLQERKKQV